jgi:hypothetical protein
MHPYAAELESEQGFEMLPGACGERASAGRERIGYRGWRD